jgi:hypothetical protein
VRWSRDCRLLAYSLQTQVSKCDGSSIIFRSVTLKRILFLSLPTLVFLKAGDIPVMIVFVGLSLIYAREIPTNLMRWEPGRRLVGLFPCLTGVWLMYRTYAATVNFALGQKAWIQTSPARHARSRS